MITAFTGKNRFLSNFSPSVVRFNDIIDDREYPTVEHAYQAAKSIDYKTRREISRLDKPGDAKRKGNKIKLRGDWEKIKLQVMEELVRQKFTRHALLRDKLLATGEEELIEGNNWGDHFWGCIQTNGGWHGYNHLGKILMKVRKDLQGV
jgi:ribA/ribD-fused uncharacterized protein